MADKIDAKSILPQGAVGNVEIEQLWDRRIRVGTRIGVTALAFLVIAGATAFCCYLIATRQEAPAQAWSTLTAIIGAMVGFLYGKNIA
jgi:hypothetical protein